MWLGKLLLARVLEGRGWVDGGCDSPLVVGLRREGSREHRGYRAEIREKEGEE